MEGREGDDGVEVGPTRFPCLEVADLDLGLRNVAPGDVRELRRQLDAGDRVAALRELDRRLTRPGPDLEHTRARL